MEWLKQIARIILKDEISESNKIISTFSTQIDGLKKEITNLKYPNPKEQELNNKYPTEDLTYLRHETDGDYKIDLRNFINPYDSFIPKVDGKTDEEKAVNGLKIILDNIKYIDDKSDYGFQEYWSYSYQTWSRKKGDCEDMSILLHNILLKSGVPYWKIRLTCGNVDDGKGKVGHCFVTYYYEKENKWVLLDCCYYPNSLPIELRKDYKEEIFYKETWFSWNQKYCFTKDIKLIEKVN